VQRVVDEELCAAAGSGNVAEIERLIAAGANPNAFEGQEDLTSLQAASMNGRVAAIVELVRAGAHVNAKSYHGVTSLMFAAVSGHTAAMDALIAAGADMNALDVDRHTALHMASIRGHVDAVRLLLDSGARVDVRNKSSKRPADVVRSCRDRHRLCSAACCGGTCHCASTHDQVP